MASFYWLLGSERNKIQCKKSKRYINYARTLNGGEREASSESPPLLSLCEGYYYVILEVVCVSLERCRISSIVK